MHALVEQKRMSLVAAGSYPTAAGLQAAQYCLVTPVVCCSHHHHRHTHFHARLSPSAHPTPILLSCHPLVLPRLTLPTSLDRLLEPEKEAALADITARITGICSRRGVLLKPFFDDAAQDDHSAKLYGHVTHTQFKQCLNVKVGCAWGTVGGRGGGGGQGADGTGGAAGHLARQGGTGHGLCLLGKS